MVERVRDVLKGILPATVSGKAGTLMTVGDMDHEVDARHGHVLPYYRCARPARPAAPEATRVEAA
jgi:hypothetical protein